MCGQICIYKTIFWELFSMIKILYNTEMLNNRKYDINQDRQIILNIIHPYNTAVRTKQYLLNTKLDV